MSVTGTCSVQCGGRCCEDFPLSHTPDRVAINYEWAVCSILAGEATAVDSWDWECVTIAEMVIPISESDEARMRYTCRHHDTKTGLCTIYDRRPRMCSDFPGYGLGGACHICGYVNPDEIADAFVQLARAAAT